MPFSRSLIFESCTVIASFRSLVVVAHSKLFLITPSLIRLLSDFAAFCRSLSFISACSRGDANSKSAFVPLTDLASAIALALAFSATC